MADKKPVSFEDYKLAGQDDGSFDLLHPDGSTFKVAKDGLNPSTLDSISSMTPVQAAEVARDPAADPSLLSRFGHHIGDSIRHGVADTAQAFGTIGKTVASPVTELVSGLAKGASGVPNTPPLIASNQPVGVPGLEGQTPAPGGPVDLGQTIAAPQAGQAIKAADAAGGPAAGGDMAKAFALQQQGIKDQQAALTEKSKAEADIYGKQAAQIATDAQKFEVERNKLNTENDNLTKSIMDGKIKPKEIWHGSTGNKILAAVSLALGGLAQGLTKSGKNPALEVINKVIDDDIAAQRANLDNKRSLLAQNLAKMGNLDAAEARTRSQLTAATTAQVQQAAARAGTTAAKAQAEGLSGQLKAQQIQYNTEQAKKVVLQNVGRPGTPSVNPESLPEDVRERLIELPSGEQRLVRNKADVKDITDELSTIKPLFSQLEALDKIGSSALHDKGQREKAFAIRSNIAMLLKENQNLKRLGQSVGADGEKDSISVLEQFEDPTKFESILNGNTKMPVLKKYLADKLEAKLAAKLSNYQAPHKPKSETPYVAQK